MSQAKVDRYKESKKNRKKEIKKAKRNKALTRIVGVLVGAAIACWIGYSGYSSYQSNKPMTYTEVNMDAITNYLNSLSTSTE
jgi:hypothetical protein